MRRHKRWLVLLAVAACTTAITTTTIRPTTTTVELIPSTTVRAASTTATTVTPVVTTGPVVTVVTVAPPLVTTVATTTPPTTRAPTVPTSPPITLAPDLAVVFSAPSEALLVASTNLVRTSIGLPALFEHNDLDFYARVWAGHLSRLGNLEHSNINTLLGPWLIVGENLAAGANMAEVAQALQASPTHYETMIQPAFTYSGVGVAVDSAGRLWVCQIFGGNVLP